MAEATVFVHPSFMDNSPNTVAEAQLVGTPVIATDCGGVSSMIRHEETGILVPPGDPELLAERLINLLADPGLRMKLAVQAQREARVRHDPQAIASQLLNTYSAICAEYKGKELA
jgi:glycosyltransferase involved in cell wall biosynthesis